MDINTGRSKERTPLSQINVTPLVDVMLVLLIIFMVTASMGQQGINVNLPRANAAALKVSDDIVVVSIDNNLKTFINSNSVAITDLAVQLKEIYKGRKAKVVFLKSDKNVAYGDFIRVVALIKSAGIEQLGMVTDAPKNN
jgi:biopolymer transport protein TolR